jgi:hypothetical protein
MTPAIATNCAVNRGDLLTVFTRPGEREVARLRALPVLIRQCAGV